MALGGGTFTVQNKILPGSYFNFVSVAQASATLSDRGVVTMPLALDWGAEGKIFTVTGAELMKNSLALFGYDYTAEALKPIRELFRHAKTAHLFRLGTGGKQAENTLATARYPGTRGNALSIAVTANEKSGEPALYDVATCLDGTEVDRQKGVKEVGELTDNDFVTWKSGGSLSLTPSLPLSGGKNGTVADKDYQTYLEQAERYSFHAMGCMESKSAVTDLFAAFTRRMREEVGKKFQTVLFRCSADYEGVVSLQNGTEGDSDSTALIPWVVGVIGGTAVNQSATNLTYDGEYAADCDYTQTALEEKLREGHFVLHQVDDTVRVLRDINSLVTVTAEKSADFSGNQTVRVLDQIANDIGVLFGKKYLGKIPNDAAGRVSLWNDIVQHHRQLETLRAIEDFDSAAVTVERGESKRSVVVTDYVTPVSAMEQLYMTVYVE